MDKSEVDPALAGRLTSIVPCARSWNEGLADLHPTQQTAPLRHRLEPIGAAANQDRDEKRGNGPPRDLAKNPKGPADP